VIRPLAHVEVGGIGAKRGFFNEKDAALAGEAAEEVLRPLKYKIPPKMRYADEVIKMTHGIST
jgi:hypothetical protein